MKDTKYISMSYDRDSVILYYYIGNSLYYTISQTNIQKPPRHRKCDTNDLIREQSCDRQAGMETTTDISKINRYLMVEELVK